MKLPIIFLLHPVGVGATREMNVRSAKVWIRTLVDILPNVVISAPWLPYAEVMVDRERGLRDAFACIERHDAAVAVGGEFSRGMSEEWEKCTRLSLPKIDLTLPPMPGLLTYETFTETRTPAFQQAVIDAFSVVVKVKAAA